MTFALAGVCLGLVGLFLLLFFSRQKPSIAVQPEAREPVVRPAPSDAVDSTPASRPSTTEIRRRPPQPAAQPGARQPASEALLLSQLHDLAGSDPELSLKLAREAVARFPDSPNAPEFEWNVVKALFNERRLDEAEAEARIMLSKYPASSFTGDVVHHLLNHPPNPPGVP